jgi:hypothetical protein
LGLRPGVAHAGVELRQTYYDVTVKDTVYCLWQFPDGHNYDINSKVYAQVYPATQDQAGPSDSRGYTSVVSTTMTYGSTTRRTISHSIVFSVTNCRKNAQYEASAEDYYRYRVTGKTWSVYDTYDQDTGPGYATRFKIC